MSSVENTEIIQGIAIVGMAGRFPGAADIAAFWENLRSGRESIAFLTDEELLADGVPPQQLAHPQFVRAGAMLTGADEFDAAYFGYSAREAELMDPQQRIFLEVALEALEHAGCDPARCRGKIGLFAGAGPNNYLISNLLPNRSLLDAMGGFQTVIGNDKDYLATRVAYKLDLKGPAISVQTACSTSLVAVSLACQSLLTYQSDVAMAGGVSVGVPQAGYVFQEGGILSPDGHCRAFDADARGTIPGNGAGVVVLKRLEDALQERDAIYAVIRGFAVNNDGAAKIGYTAPSTEGQAQVVAEALAMAEADPRTISYIEAHGTGTDLGDPVEVAALTRVFRASTPDIGFCALGSLKTNVGHLDTAAGVAGLIKAALSLSYRELPASLHFRAPNPKLNLERSPFYVNAQLRPWPAGGSPRRAGVSSFGIGGTNAHVILEEAPATAHSGPSRPWQLLTLSARTPTALDAAARRLAKHMRTHPEQPLPDAAFTQQMGRRLLQHRRAVLCQDRDGAIAALETGDGARVIGGYHEGADRPIAFLFPGQGAQYAGMGRGLYGSEPVFREAIDRCSAILHPLLDFDLRGALYPQVDSALSSDERQKQTALAQVALFAVEYALAQLWISWGMRPQAMIGHSVGEYVAACLAGVFSLEDGLALVAERGRLMGALPSGSMLAVSLPEAEAARLLHGGLALAAVNGPRLCVIAGPADQVAALHVRLQAQGVQCRPLHTSHAFHSSMMEPVLAPFADRVRRVALKAPTIPYMSNVTGTWIKPGEATDPGYWTRHLRQTVRFAGGITELLAGGARLLLEVGPGQALSTFVRQQGGAAPGLVVLPSLRHPQEAVDDAAFLLGTLGRLWVSGAPVDWEAFSAGERRHKVPLPAYPFERRRYWINPPHAAVPATPEAEAEVAAAAEVQQHDRPALQTEYMAPRTGAETRVAAIWRELLGVERIGVHDNFFELGGHSLLAVQLTYRLREALDLDLTLGDVFAMPTIAGQADAAGRVGQEPQGSAAIAVVDRAGPLPVSPAQERTWLLERADRSKAWSLHMSFPVRLLGPLDVRRLEEALSHLVLHHEVLRTSYPDMGGRPAPRIHPPQPVTLPLNDLSHLPQGEREAEVERLAEAEFDAPFDLERGPLVRVGLIRLAPEEHVFLFTAHSLIFDGTSLTQVFRDLSREMTAMAAGQPPGLGARPIHYLDFAAWQRAWLQTERAEADLQYWREQLGGRLPKLTLPADMPAELSGGADGRGRSALAPFRWSPELTDGVKRLTTAEGSTLFMTLLAGFEALLFRHTGQEEMLVGTYTSNRTRPETADMIGPFVNTLVLRGRVHGRQSFAELLRHVRDVCLGAYRHQDLPYEEVLRQVQPELYRSYTTPFAATFVVYDAGGSLELPGLTVRRLTTGRLKLDWALSAWELEEGIGGVLEYNAARFSAPAIQRVLHDFEHVMIQVTRDPAIRLDELLSR